jgi:hypothetical protein
VVVWVTPDTAFVTVVGGGPSTGGVTVGTTTGAGSELAFAGSGLATGGAVGAVEATGTARG